MSSITSLEMFMKRWKKAWFISLHKLYALKVLVTLILLIHQVVDALEAGGAKKTSYLSGLNTHCIVGEEPEYNDINEATDMLDVLAVNQVTKRLYHLK